MATIKRLSPVHALSGGDTVPMWSERQEDTRKFSITTLTDYFSGTFATNAELEAIQIGGVLTQGQWIKLPAIYKLLFDGTGTVTLDTRDRSGTITTAAATYTVDGQSEDFPYFDGAYEVRASYTGTASAEVI